MKIKNLNINCGKEQLKKALKIAGGVTIGTVAFAISIMPNKSNEVYKQDFDQYKIYIDETTKEKNTMTLFEVGNFEVKGESNLKDIKKANKKSIPCGIIISTIASNKADIYNDVEYAKYIIENSDIDCPVYLNIDELIKNPALRVDEMLELISSFASKLTANKVFVGVCGKEENIDVLLKNDSNNILALYDIFLLDDNSDINLSVSSMIRVDEKGDYITTQNFPEICESKDLNNPDNFLSDKVHVVQEGETFASIAYTYGLSVEDLIKYNECNIKKMPKTLRIPTQPVVINNNSSNTENVNVKGKYIMTLDMSSAQEKINWDFLEKNYDLLILKAAAHVDIATKFEDNSAECAKRNIPYTAYVCNYVSYKTNYGDRKTAEEIRKAHEIQINAVIGILANKNIQFPVFLDFEDFANSSGTPQREFASYYNDEQCCIMLDVWYDMLTKAGYTPGIYSNIDLTNKLQRAYDKKYGKGSFEKKFVLWTAGSFLDGYDFGSKIEFDEIDKIVSDEKTLFSHKGLNVKSDLVQVTENGRNFGAGTSSGAVDVNFIDTKGKFFKGLKTEQNEINYDIQKTKKPSQQSEFLYNLSNEYPATETFCAAIAIGSLGLVIYTLNKKNQKEKKYNK